MSNHYYREIDLQTPYPNLGPSEALLLPSDIMLEHGLATGRAARVPIWMA